MTISVCQLVSVLLCFRLKYHNNHWMFCHEILHSSQRMNITDLGNPKQSKILTSSVKYLNMYYMDCHKFYRHSRSPKGESYYTW